MKNVTNGYFVAAIVSGLYFFSVSAHAGPIDIFEFSVYFASSETGPPSLRDTVIGMGPTTLTAGLDATFANGLDGDNVGTMTYTLTNNTGGDLTNVSLFGFLDAEIDEAINTFFNEFGTTADLVLGGGSGDGLADSFEIDEPGFVFGDIIGNLLAGSLDNTNALQPALSDDVSMALGFDIGTLLAGQSIVATFDISLFNNNGLGHVDPNSNFQFWYNGSVELSDPITPVPAPATLLLVGLGLGIMWMGRARRRTIPFILGALSLGVAGAASAGGGGDPVGDTNPPICNCFSKGDEVRDYGSFDIFFDSFVFCSISDSRPTEDSNGNGILDPGEDQNGNNIIDEDTGICDVSLQPGSLNAELFVFFSPGDPFVFADISTDDFSGPATFTLQATDCAGNMCLPAIQLNEFDPTGGLDMFPSTTINIPIPLPPNPGGPPITAVQCIDLDPLDFAPTPTDFDNAPFTPVNGDPTIIPNYTFNDSGDRVLCCQFALDDGSVSSPLCAFTTVDPGQEPDPPLFVAGRPKPGKIDLLWSAVDGADEYIINRGQGPIGVAKDPIGMSTDTLFVDFDVFPGTIYTYTIQTVAGGLVSAPSVEFQVFIPAIRGDKTGK